MGLYRAFGLGISSGFPLPGLPEEPERAGPAVRIELASPAELALAWSGESDRPEAVGWVHAERFKVSLGTDGDLLCTYGEHAVYHVSAAADRILCSPSDREELAWQRELLDTVLWLTALAHGYETLHASAVERPDGVVAVVAWSGGGKSSLAAELIRGGCRLFSDDVLVLEGTGAEPRCHPGPGLMNLPLSTPPDEVAALGAPVGRIGDELWVAAFDVAREPDRLAAVCFLDRTADGPPRMTRVNPTPFDLRPHMFVHPFLDQRERSRFLMSADLLASVPMWSLEAGPAASPAELAELVAGLSAPELAEVSS